MPDRSFQCLAFGHEIEELLDVPAVQWSPGVMLQENEAGGIDHGILNIGHSPSNGLPGILSSHGPSPTMTSTGRLLLRVSLTTPTNGSRMLPVRISTAAPDASRRL